MFLGSSCSVCFIEIWLFHFACPSCLRKPLNNDEGWLQTPQTKSQISTIQTPFGVAGLRSNLFFAPPWLQKIERIYNLNWSMIFREHDVDNQVNHWDRSKISMWPRGDRIKTLRFSEITLVSTSSRVSTQLLNIEKQQKYIQALIMWEEIFRTPAPASTNARLVAFGIAEYL